MRAKGAAQTGHAQGCSRTMDSPAENRNKLLLGSKEAVRFVRDPKCCHLTGTETYFLFKPLTNGEFTLSAFY